MTWKNLGENEILQGKEFYISYNPNTGLSHGPFTDLGNLMLGITGKDAELTDGSETALKHDQGTWLILTGDFRDEYTKAFPNGYDACLEVYKKNKETHRNAWSTD